MPIDLPCPRCGAVASVAEESLGRRARCRKCGEGFTLARPGGAPEPSSPIGLPESFGRYRILKPLGQGGMGAVYLAHDTKLDRRVALKVPYFHPSDGPQAVGRFEREARAAATLDHPNLCPVFDVGEVDGIHYLTMPYIEGRPLSGAIPQGQQLPEAQAAALTRKLALALGEAHARGVVHRDLKPGNIMVNRRREPVIMDFGLARMAGGDDAPLTRTGNVLGTALYMAPEQATGELAAAGPACDVYSLGVILYELLAGCRPFEGPWALVIGLKNVKDPDPPSTHRPGLSPALDAICRKAIARDPGERYPTMAAFAGALDGFLASADAPAPGQAAPDLRLAAQVFAGIVTEDVSSLRESSSLGRVEPSRVGGASPRRRAVPWVLGTAGAAILAIAFLSLARDRRRVEPGGPTALRTIPEDRKIAPAPALDPDRGKAPETSGPPVTPSNPTEAPEGATPPAAPMPGSSPSPPDPVDPPTPVATTPAVDATDRDELIKNPGAEDRGDGKAIPSWTSVIGDWTGGTTAIPPFEGRAYFAPGNVAYAELVQDVDIGRYTNPTKNKKARPSFRFSARVRSYPQSPPDYAQVVIEYLDRNKAIAPVPFAFPPAASVAGWRELSAVVVPPPSTRYLRISLRSHRSTGGANDGVFDALSLKPIAPEPTPSPASRPSRAAENPTRPPSHSFVINGDWRIEGDELVQTERSGFAQILLGDGPLSSYNLRFKVKLMDGPMGPRLFTPFHYAPPLDHGSLGDQYWFEIKDRQGDGQKAAIYSVTQGKFRRETDWVLAPLEYGRWYPVELLVRGKGFAVMFEGRPMLQGDLPNFSGWVGLGSASCTTRYKDIRITNLKEEPLWEGLPDDLPGR